MKLKIIFVLSIVILYLYTDKNHPIVDNKLLIDNKFPYLEKLIWVESRNNPNAVSHKQAVGLMQITQVVLDDYYTFAGIRYSLKEMKDVKKNLEVGKWQLSRLKKYYNCDIKTVSSFNMGAGNTDAGIINFAYTFAILGTNRVMKWVGDRKLKPWKGTRTCYYVID